MPGLVGAFGPAAPASVRRMERALFAPPDERCAARAERGLIAITAFSRVASFAAEVHGAAIAAYEGAPLGLPHGAPAQALAALVSGQGGAPRVVGGSWIMAAAKEGVVELAADATASRPLFYARHPDGSLLFAPELRPLARSLPRLTLDAANITQLLARGRMFADGSPVEEIRRLAPGERVRFDGERVQREAWIRYETGGAPGIEAEREAPLLEELGRRIDAAILARYQAARAPAILLSGGYDSRYIFHVLRSQIGGAALRTVFWGDGLDAIGSDAQAAAALARRHGVRHTAIARRPERVIEDFDRMFDAQSGMTELCFGHADELSICEALAEDQGVGSILRGDEIFGPTGATAPGRAAALDRVGLAPAGAINESDAWFAGEATPWLDAHAREVERRAGEVSGDPDDVRDTLYMRERLPAHNHPLSYHKSHHLDVVNPLLEPPILAQNASLPAALRRDKALFKRSYALRFGDLSEVPIATVGNALDWARVLRERPEIAAFAEARLRDLAPPFDAAFFLEQLRRVRAGEGAPRGPRPLSVAPELLVMRGVVLSRWMDALNPRVPL